MRLSRTEMIQAAFILVILIAVGAMFANVFMGFDTDDNSLGIDNIFGTLRDWNIRYDVVNGLRNPPWSVLPLLPLGQLPKQAAWGLLIYLSIIVQVTSVPRTRKKGLYLTAVLAVVLSFPSLRNFADANLEGLLIAGAVLTVAGYARRSPWILALGLLLVTVKPQACFVLLPVLALYVLVTWPPSDWLRALALVLAVVIPTMLWRGSEWLDAVGGTYQAGSIIDISLSAALERTGAVPDFITWVLMGLLLAGALWMAYRSNRTLSREKAAMLMVTSMLLSPYTAGNTVITVLAVGIIPLFLDSPRLGCVLILLINVPYLFLGNREILVDYQSYWWTFILLLAWTAFNWRIYRREIAPYRDLARPVTAPSQKTM